MSRRSRWRLLAGSASLAASTLLVAACASAPVASAQHASSAPVQTKRARSAAAPASRVLRGPSAPPDFTDLTFPDANDGWLLGEPAAYEPGSGPAAAGFWHTATGGATWQEQWHGAGLGLSITATDAAHAWALITCASGSSKASCGRKLMATSDRGRRWRVVAALPHDVNRVQFVTERFGIATADNCLTDRSATRCRGQILVSHNGGASWTTVLADASPVFATANDTGQLWAAETTPGTGDELGSGITFLTSANGGRSWQPLGQFDNGVPLTPQVQIRLAASGGGLGWASLFDIGSCAMHGCGTATLLQSEDGGQAWSPVSLTFTMQGCTWSSIVFSAAPDGSVMAATALNGAACSPPFGMLYRHGSSGWRQLPSWMLTSVSSLVTVSRDVAYAITDQDVIARTTDGGRHWTQLLPALVPAGQADPVSATTSLGDQDTGFDAGAIVRTENGGRSWQRVADLPGLVTWLDFPSAADGVAVTYQSGRPGVWELWRSRDLGAAWDLAGHLPAGKGANDGIAGPWMSSDGHGLLLALTGTQPWQEAASGASGPARIWTTSDWGATWTEGGLLPLDGDSLQGPASFGYAPGSSGGMAAGLAGGQAGWTGWLIVATPSFGTEVVETRGRALVRLPVPAGNDIQLVGYRTGFAWTMSGTGAGGLVTLYRTTDGGRSWQRARFRLDLAPGFSGTLAFAFTDAAHGWLVAAGATWRTSDGGRSWDGA